MKIGTKCYASGWGTISTTTGASPNKLHAVDLNVVDHQVCYERYENCKDMNEYVSK